MASRPSTCYMMELSKDAKVWTRPRSKIYDLNKVTGVAYYKPMIEYIDAKERRGVLDIKVNKNTGRLVRSTDLSTRDRVEFPEIGQVNIEECKEFDDAPPRVMDFLTTFGAAQIKESNKVTVHVKNEMQRNSKLTTTLHDRRPSTMIRNEYTKEIRLMHKSGAFDKY